MKLRHMMIAIGIMAGLAASPAAAQSCYDAETSLRSEAAVLGPMLTRMSEITADYNASEEELNAIYDYAEQYGWDDDSDFAAWDLEEWLFDLESQYNQVYSESESHDAALLERVREYEAACGASARTAEVLAEYQIVLN